MILERLRRETADLHAAVETVTGFDRDGFTPARYVRLLEGFHGFVGPLEGRLGAAIGDEAFLAPRRKAALLDADLCHFGHDAESLGHLPICRRLPETAGRAGWGVLYVLEGSTLGGTVIGRRLAAEHGIGPGAGARYMTSYGAEVGAMWQGFRRRLAAEAGAGEGDDAIVAGARDAFRTLADWLRLTLATGGPACSPTIVRT